MKPIFTASQAPVLVPVPNCYWADTMILNPAIIKDPNSNTIHMLFRASGPCLDKKLSPDCEEPYPIFLGYAKSDDKGKTWQADFSRPALAPAVKYNIDELYITDDEGNKVPNYANGCIEDPRIFDVCGELYMSVACRMFPPGPYWARKDVRRNIPDWVSTKENPFGDVASKNHTTTVLYKINLDRLKNKDYDSAFIFICNLTDSAVSDNRDVFIFQDKMMINGKMQYVMLHRPYQPIAFDADSPSKKPSIFIAAVENIKDFATDKAVHKFLAGGVFDWEEEKIGGSWAPIKSNNGEWLIPYHGKTFPGYGYSQSFMILREVENDFPKIVHRCSERLMYPQFSWEMPDKYPCPCLFSTGGAIVDETLVISYGAADERVGIGWVNFNELVEYVRTFDQYGKVVNNLYK